MPTARFRPCVTFTYAQEGGYSDDRRDGGNWSSGEVNVGRFIGSQRGISAPTLIRWAGPHATVTASMMRGLPIATSDQIYAVEYFNAAGCGGLPAGVDLLVFDFAVNAGVAASVRQLQGILGGLDVDGVCGTLTQAAAAKADVPTLIENLASARSAFYRGLSGFPLYGQGWLARTRAALAAALRDHAATAVTVNAPARIHGHHNHQERPA